MDEYWAQLRDDLADFLEVKYSRPGEMGRFMASNDAALLRRDQSIAYMERLAGLVGDEDPLLFFSGMCRGDGGFFVLTAEHLHVVQTHQENSFPLSDITVQAAASVEKGEVRLLCGSESFVLTVMRPVSVIQALRYYLISGELPLDTRGERDPVMFAEPLAGARGTLFFADERHEVTVDVLLLDTGHVVMQEILGALRVEGRYLLERELGSEDLFLTSTAALQYQTPMTGTEMGRAAAGAVVGGVVGLLTVGALSHLAGQHTSRGIRGDRPVLLVREGDLVHQIVFNDAGFADFFADARAIEVPERPAYGRDVPLEDVPSVIGYLERRRESIAQADAALRSVDSPGPAPWVSGAGTRPGADARASSPAPWQSADDATNRVPHAPLLLGLLGGWAPLAGPALTLFFVVTTGAWSSLWTVPASFVNGIFAFRMIMKGSGWAPESRVPKLLVVAVCLYPYGWWGLIR